MKTTRITKELKYQSIDSTFVEDINGSKFSSYNKIYKRRKGEASKGIKISSLVTTKGIRINIDSGNKYDSPLLPKIINNCIINTNTKKYTNHNRYKQYLFADSGYDSKENHDFLINKGYIWCKYVAPNARKNSIYNASHCKVEPYDIPIIIQNKRNIKNMKLLRKRNKRQNEIYKKRSIIENYHSWLKKFPKIKLLYERNIYSYRGLVLLGISVLIYRRIN